MNVVRTTIARPSAVALAARGTPRRASRRAFVGVCALLFIASAVLTVIGCVSMSTAGEMPMPGGWSMSIAWSRMCGQSWPRAAMSFVGMWIVMMVAMMLPSLAPVLWRYHEAVGRLGHAHARAARLTAAVGIGYFVVWAALGAAVFPPGAALAALAWQWPALARTGPLALGAVLLMAGMLQFSAWKAHLLASCRPAFACAQALPPEIGAAWRTGVRHGLHCAGCCAGLMIVLLAAGMIDLRAMAAVTVATTAERLAPQGESVARVIGAVIVMVGLLMFVRVAATGT